jgi:hypothetical protein
MASSFSVNVAPLGLQRAINLLAALRFIFNSSKIFHTILSWWRASLIDAGLPASCDFVLRSSQRRYPLA